MAHKQKGIVLQSVKDILGYLYTRSKNTDSLVSDHLVTTEKIGTSNYFWSFPSSAGLIRKQKIDQLTQECHELKEKEAQLLMQLQEAKKLRPESEMRSKYLEEYAFLEKKNTELKQELSLLKDRDPAVLEAKKEETKKLTKEANMWTDNIFILQSYCLSNFNISNQQFCTQFGIPEDLDSV